MNPYEQPPDNTIDQPPIAMDCGKHFLSASGLAVDLTCQECVSVGIVIPDQPDQTKYERDTLIWMLIDIAGESNTDLFNEAIAEIKKLKETREGATHWVNNAVHFQQQAGQLQERLAASQRLIESQRDVIRKLRSEEWETRSLLELIADPEPCSLDHKGYCQEHLWVGKGECAHGRARKLLGHPQAIVAGDNVQ